MELETLFETQRVAEHKTQFRKFEAKIASSVGFEDFQDVQQELDELKWGLANRGPEDMENDPKMVAVKQRSERSLKKTELRKT